MSKYDSIRTAAAMVKEVQMHGLSMEQDDLNRVADIFGNSTIDELVALANDIGRNNANGEPDPKGSMSSGREPTRGTFYSIISHIWNWEEVTRFWNLYTNPEHEKLYELKIGIKDLEGQLAASRVESETVRERWHEELDKRVKIAVENGRLKTQLHDKDMEIMRLKAELYDLMVKEEKE